MLGPFFCLGHGFRRLIVSFAWVQEISFAVALPFLFVRTDNMAFNAHIFLFENKDLLSF